jgi:hypothetical protein
MTKHQCACGRPGVVNLATLTGWPKGKPDEWECAECGGRAINSPEARALTEADLEMSDFLEGGGKLS